MGRPEEPLTRDGSPLLEFAFWLRDLRNRSGLTYEQLAKRTNYATSTVQAAAAGQRLPTQTVTMAIVQACGGDTRTWREYWAATRRAMDDGAPGAVGKTITPPWGGSSVPTSQPREPAPDDGDGWYVESFTALLLPHADPIEAVERRRIVATVDDLGELVTSVSVPRSSADTQQDHGLESELLYGGSLERRRQPYDSFFQNVIVLPRRLRRGESHEYALRLRIPDGQPMASHYVHIPFCRSDHFDLYVRFDPRRRPESVWVLTGAPPPLIYQREPSGQILDPDRFGEVHVSFDGLRPGLGYGICWRDQTSPGS
jgi:transcriptional regulator with XRE-family HTH domain